MEGDTELGVDTAEETDDGREAEAGAEADEAEVRAALLWDDCESGGNGCSPPAAVFVAVGDDTEADTDGDASSGALVAEASVSPSGPAIFTLVLDPLSA